MALLREPTDRITHGEMIANPDFIQLAPGIDGWGKPRSARAAQISRSAVNTWALPPDDTLIPCLQEPEVQTDENVLKVSHLQDIDYSDLEPEELDFGIGEGGLAQKFQKELEEQRASKGGLALSHGGFYNTLFIWPLQVFGSELFMELSLLYPEECKGTSRDFAELSSMVREMAEIGREIPGYFFCVGDHITNDPPPAAVKCYFDPTEEYNQR
jgi:hypothetical protein